MERYQYENELEDEFEDDGIEDLWAEIYELKAERLAELEDRFIGEEIRRWAEETGAEMEKP